MKIIIYLIYTIICLFVGAVTGWTINTIYQQVTGPSQKDVAFVKSCGELNGKPFTLASIKALDGWCYVSEPEKVFSEPCEEKHVQRYFDLLASKKAGQKYFNTGAEEVGIFNVSQYGLDGVWGCSMSLVEQDKSIRAVPYFIYD